MKKSKKTKGSIKRKSTAGRVKAMRRPPRTGSSRRGGTGHTGAPKPALNTGRASSSRHGGIKQNIKDTQNRPEYKTPYELIEQRSDFPEEVMKETAHIRNSLSRTAIEKEMKKGRRDLRHLTLVTIDSEETKDVDDAVSIYKNNDGTYVLGVHIADVSHYVREESMLDKEAYERGTSVYLADKVLHMLPRKLSNGICSLNVGEDRFALSVIMHIDRNGDITGHEIFESIINVKYKITYEQIYALMEGDTDKYTKSSLEKEFEEHINDLYTMRELAQLRHAVRYKRGAIDFDFPETHIIMDENGEPAGIEAYRITFANNIIEEFMLAANETVAGHFAKIDAPILYRVHGLPEEEKLFMLSETVRAMGYWRSNKKSPKPGHITSGDIQALLESVKGKMAEPVISSLALRAMQKAEYSDKNDGHFGLAAEYYTHFTSPIRRYPDLFVHRVIKSIIHGEMSAERRAAFKSLARTAAPHCSEREREAENAERMYIDMLAAEYMSGHTGDVFEGTVCNITSFGIFVRLDNSAEGLVFYNSMREYMIFDSKKMIAIGEHSRRKIAVGDRVRVKVAGCNINLGQIEFYFTK